MRVGSPAVHNEDETMSIQEKKRWPGNNKTINRRTFIGMSAGFCLGAGLGRSWPQIAGGRTAVVKTTNGPVQGVVENGVQTFKGLRYAAPPLGPLRFMPPQKPKPWTAVADAEKLGA